MNTLMIVLGSASAGCFIGVIIASLFRAGAIAHEGWVVAPRVALSAPQGEVERLREARNTALEEAATVAIHNSNFGHVEGNKRAFKIADEIRGRKDAQPEAGGEQ